MLRDPAAVARLRGKDLEELVGAMARAASEDAGDAKKSLKITQIRSGIGFDKKQTLALRGLGLRRIRHTVEVEDTPSTRGLILRCGIWSSGRGGSVRGGSDRCR